MGLTVFIGKADPQVLIVESFRQRPGDGAGFEYFSGRPRRMTFKDFRARGVAVVKAHLKLFKTKIVEEKDIVPVFVQNEAERLLRKRSAVSMCPDYFNDGKGLRFCALRFRKYDLGGMIDVGSEYHRCLPEKWSAAQFWAVFRLVLEDAPGVASLEQLGFEV
jgi:hypothetical protein